MPSDIRRSSAAVKAEADAVCARCNGGYLRIYTGPAASEDEPADEAAMLSEHQFSSRAFLAADGNGRARADDITPDEKARRDGEPTWFRAYRMDGTTPVFQGSAGADKDNDLVITVRYIIEGSAVYVADFSYTAPKRKA